MPAQKKPWYTRLRAAVEDCEQLQDDPDQFALLINVVMADTKSPIDFLAQCAGFTHDRQKPVIEDWATGAVMPTPRMRRKVVRGVREHFAQAFKGP